MKDVSNTEEKKIKYRILEFSWKRNREHAYMNVMQMKKSVEK